MKKFTYLVIATAALSMVACTGGNKAGYTITGTVDVYIGEPVSPEEIQNIADDKDLAEFLYQRTYASTSAVKTCASYNI